MTRAPVLVIGIGNPSRGDDALGPAVVARLEELLRAELAGGQVETLVDFQLQIEHTLDISGRDRVFIVDASVGAASPLAIGRVAANDAPSPFSHAMSPAELLGVYERTFGPAPPVWTVAVRGRTFELGAPIGDEAPAHVEPAARANGRGSSDGRSRRSPHRSGDGPGRRLPPLGRRSGDPSRSLRNCA